MGLYEKEMIPGHLYIRTGKKVRRKSCGWILQ